MRRTELRRVPMPRGETTLRRLTKLKPRSTKRQAIAPQRAELVRELLAERPWCEIRWDDRCQGRAVDVDERLSRAQGGSILDPDNCQTACRHCHDSRHANPTAAAERGVSIERRGRTST